MVEKLTLLFIWFVLTTIAGGLLGTLLQHRAWRYKWETESLEKNISTSRELFQEISRLMDRRLYRLDQFYLWPRRGSPTELKVSLENYRSVVFDWNDSINRHLSMLQIFLGKDIREKFDLDLGAKFISIGALVENFYHLEKKDDEELQNSIKNGIRKLRSEVYHYNLVMLKAIEGKTTVMSTHAGILDDLKKLLLRAE
jgi:hypothetical protein